MRGSHDAAHHKWKQVVDYYERGYSPKEIASLLNYSLGFVYSILRRERVVLSNTPVKARKVSLENEIPYDYLKIKNYIITYYDIYTKIISGVPMKKLAHDYDCSRARLYKIKDTYQEFLKKLLEYK